MRTLRIAPAFALGALLTLAGCGDSDGTRSGPGNAPAERASRADDLVVRVATSGGVVPPDAAEAGIPEVSIFGDGRIVTIGPTIAISPGPALPNLGQGQLEDHDLDAILAAADDAGLLGDEPPDYGEVAVSDSPTTVVTVDDGEEHEVSVYALGFDDGLSGDQKAAREQLSDFIASLPTDSVSAPYRPTRVAVLFRPYVTDELPAAGQETWPLDDLAGAGDDTGRGDFRCLLVKGDDVSTVLAAADGASAGARWRSGDADYFVVFRPLLPDEQTCADLPS